MLKDNKIRKISVRIIIDVILGLSGSPNNTLRLILAESFSGLIWKVMVHKSGTIVIETRDKELHQVSFSAFNYKTGKSYFKDHVFQEDWNLSLAYAGVNNLILIGYKNSDTPESNGILSVNLDDGKILWQKYHISLSQVSDQGLEVYETRVAPKKYFFIDHLRSEKLERAYQNNDELEITFPETNDTFAIPDFIQRGDLVGPVSILKYSDKIFLSFHENEEGNLRQRLIVYQHDEILIDDILISGIQKLQPEAFFIQQNHLFYIRHKKEIVTYLV